MDHIEQLSKFKKIVAGNQETSKEILKESALRKFPNLKEDEYDYFANDDDDDDYDYDYEADPYEADPVIGNDVRSLLKEKGFVLVDDGPATWQNKNIEIIHSGDNGANPLFTVQTVDGQKILYDDIYTSNLLAYLRSDKLVMDLLKESALRKFPNLERKKETFGKDFPFESKSFRKTFEKVDEAWDVKMNPGKDKGKFKGDSKEEIKAGLERDKKKKNKTAAVKKDEHQREFALRAKNKFGKIKESKLTESMQGLIGELCDKLNFYNFEGSRGIQRFTQLVKIIGGYDSLDEFFEDNSGAFEAIISWIESCHIPEWEQNIKNYLGSNDEDEGF